jgi:demethylmenaquinone methyltransferase/2-methoxy-6-polyprenyl-1,4-benzoquinol methylase
MIDQISEHAKRVKDVFNRVASKYDVMNDLMSLGLHRVWKRQFVQRLSIKPDAHYVDVAAGTGDVTRLIHNAVLSHGLNPSISAVDSNEMMIGQGKAKLIDKGLISGVTWVQASAENLPFDDNSVDALTISFGLRNVSDIQKGLSEFYRVLKPGGQFLCLEFSEVQHKSVNTVYKFYSQNVIPKIGDYIVGKQKEAPYEYLVDSIQQFPNQQTLQSMIESAEFKNATYTNLTDGIVAIHEGWK